MLLCRSELSRAITRDSDQAVRADGLMDEDEVLSAAIAEAADDLRVSDRWAAQALREQALLQADAIQTEVAAEAL